MTDILDQLVDSRNLLGLLVDPLLLVVLFVFRSWFVRPMIAEFRRRQGKLANDDSDIQIRRDQQICAEADRAIRTVKVVQGAAKEARQVIVSRDQSPPAGNGESVPLWIRDGWSASEKELLDAARAAGTDSPTVFVFLPRQAADELRKLIVDAEAAQQTIDAKGTPTTRDGEEAKHSMESRRNAAVRGLNWQGIGTPT